MIKQLLQVLGRKSIRILFLISKASWFDSFFLAEYLTFFEKTRLLRVNNKPNLPDKLIFFLQFH